MEADRPSATAEGAAIMRALHQLLPAEARVLDDPIASRLVDPAGAAYQARLVFLASLSAPVRSRLTNFVMRSRYAEDCLADAFQCGTRQYVILGAGLDTFAYRQPGWAQTLRIFEVDHPATQAWKRARLNEAGIALPSNLAFAEVDFDRVSLTEGLSIARLDFAVPTFFSLLGVSQYLSTEGLEGTLALVLGMPKSSEIVLSFVLPEDALPSDDAALTAAFAGRFAAIGEPWVTRPSPDHLVAMLKRMGFSSVARLEPSEANSRYFRDRRDGLSASLMEQMVRAVV
jgi:methyltransferase (TIGR00027 family)